VQLQPVSFVIKPSWTLDDLRANVVAALVGACRHLDNARIDSGHARFYAGFISIFPIDSHTHALVPEFMIHAYVAGEGVVAPPSTRPNDHAASATLDFEALAHATAERLYVLFPLALALAPPPQASFSTAPPTSEAITA